MVSLLASDGGVGRRVALFGSANFQMTFTCSFVEILAKLRLLLVFPTFFTFKSFPHSFCVPLHISLTVKPRPPQAGKLIDVLPHSLVMVDVVGRRVGVPTFI